MFSKRIYIGGYAGSGSSAVVDYFKENPDITTLDFEQRFIVDPDGLLDLSAKLSNNPSPYDIDLAIRRFRILCYNLTKKYSLRHYSGYKLPPEAANSLNSTIANLAEKTASYKGIWLQQNHIIHQILHKIDGILNTHFSKLVHTNTYFPIDTFPTPDNLYDTFLESYLSDLLGNTNKTIVLDEPYISLSGKKLSTLSKSDYKIIAINRDPRDQYINAKRYRYQFVPQDVTGFIEWFRMQKRLANLQNQNTTRRMEIAFEDLVIRYDETIDQIDNFVGFCNVKKENKKTIFNPEISIKNIGSYKYFPQHKNDVREIEKSLPEYLSPHL